MRGEHSVGQAIGWWFVLVVLYQIILGCAIGAVIGVIARKLLKYSKRRGLIDRGAFSFYLEFVSSVLTLFVPRREYGEASFWLRWSEEVVADVPSQIANYIALALLVTGLTTLAGSDDLLAAFACGTAFAWDDW